MVRKGGYQRAERLYDGFDSHCRYTQPQSAKRPNYQSAMASVSPASSLELNKGDMVSHTAFGKGLVLSVLKMGGDALLEIAFDQVGTKKLMAKSASAHMKKL